ncbi:hypothetical protein LCGC14_0303890 [marine sediment metagenome]|uniref:site-specific DNA-methyltransferase (adenine-specific) n=1 Tax=marine sediment metagenome TaxID=412755 RepID=A0A0F9TUG7_9ZZZZ|nr:DNA methyltransferase [Phycisphaerae bacterium]HDZ42793.1 DNA methyltransferase [Phycisphaerae bacterium]
MPSAAEHISTYLTELRKQLATGVAAEHAYRPALQRLLQAHHSGTTAVNEPRRVKCGAPDFVVQRGPTPLGHVECKDIGVSLPKVLKTEQLERYLESLDNFILTDYIEFRWFVDGEQRLAARVATVDAAGKLRADPAGQTQLVELLDAFFDADAAPMIANPKQLAKRMAGVAKLIRSIIANAFDDEADTGALHEQMAGFRDVLLHDLTPPQFADMYAQTICYGLFAAIIHSKQPHKFTREHAAYDLPPTNPFLREMFTHVAGPGLDERIVWAVDHLAELLRRTDIHAILANFGKATRRDDPVVHFYETFLAHYDPKMRESRGVYYTPEPVVGYIVRSIDHILKTNFNLPDGLADATRIKHTFTDHLSGKKTTRDVHKVQILDPATGTGTFLHGVIDAIHGTFAGNEGLWDQYVREHLLPRLFGFELLMAPYAVAHMKLGLQLEQTGYTFGSNERLNVFLTNTLEEAEFHAAGLFAGLIAKEANQASHVKRDTPVMVVLGNPPYSGHSANKGEWIRGLIDDYKQVDGKPLGERNPKWLNDDYVKFIRFAQDRIERTGHGILAFISNHGYLDNPTFRGMRQSLMRTFDDIYIVDLHGNSKKKETCPDGSKDENVFDIQQGVAIGIFVRRPKRLTKPAKVRHADLHGLRRTKYQWLNEQDIESTQWRNPKVTGPAYFYVPRDDSMMDEYEVGLSVSNILPLHNIGLNSHRDAFVVDFTAKEVSQKLGELLSTEITDEELREKYSLKDTASFHLEAARDILRKDNSPERLVVECLYRPFDSRHLLFAHCLLDRPRSELNKHFLGQWNLGLAATRQSREPFATMAVNRICGQHKIVAKYDGSSIFPLYLYPDPDGKGKKDKLFAETSPWPEGPGGRRPNLAPEFVEEFAGKLGLAFVSDGVGDMAKTFGPEDIFHYMYAVFHSPTYRSRYAEFLKIDFPRLPLTGDRKLFAALCKLGGELVGLHLLEAVPAPAVNYPATGDDTVAKPRYVDTQQRVYINDDQYFEPVPADVWEFHVGGYQVCAKWLKDRKGRPLSYDDITHYRRVVTALGETIRLMSAIDAAIDHWPIT